MQISLCSFVDFVAKNKINITCFWRHLKLDFDFDAAKNLLFEI